MIISGCRCVALCCSLLFCLLTACVSANTIITTVGTDATLRCNYDAKYYGRLSVCWGRGAIPNRGCANEVIRTDGTAVISRLSERYLLRGNLGEGDVTLTIRQVQESDSGLYGCRVDIPGWFNDHKHQTTLTVNAGRPFPVKVETREVKEKTVTVRWTPPFDGGRPITAYVIEIKNKYASWDTAVRTEVSPDLSQVTLVDLRPAKTYNVRMFAANSLGTSDASNVLTITTKEAAPEGPPLDMQLQALSSHSIKVTWKPPKADLRNGVLRGYSINYREYDPVGSQFKTWQQLNVAATREVESVILTNLKPSTKYGVTVQAKTNAGIGPPSTAPLCSTLDEVQETTVATSMSSSSSTKMRTHLTSVTPVYTTTSTTETVFTSTVWESSTSTLNIVPPDPPVIEVKEVKNYAISLFWTPGFEGSSSITGFYLEYKAANASWDYTESVVDFSPNQTEVTIIEINPSTYNIRMFAKNSMSISRASNVLTVTIEEAVPQKVNGTETLPTTHPDAVTVKNSPGVPTVFPIIVPVVLVGLIVAMVTAWKLRQIKQRKGSLNMLLSNGAIRYRGSESLQEL
ncbi:Down syndrome cell adhesion molecule-like isoform X1 [Kryptolebias marmoratus]|uniref:Down syndrome cell adhesion molecule-like isoform X1 n=1 Tax=Kryptolebias marmoratus TaxID=37003 RepID=UPI0007F882C9|nr:Down syndrome cell adhesion molecule-like isoform X1 [Kryptolebias marmoratus]